MPRSSYGDKHTVTVMCGDKHQVLDFTSKVVDFFTVNHGDEESGKFYILIFHFYFEQVLL